MIDTSEIMTKRLALFLFVLHLISPLYLSPPSFSPSSIRLWRSARKAFKRSCASNYDNPPVRNRKNPAYFKHIVQDASGCRSIWPDPTQLF
ncbi:hypothetical protein EPR50_G00034990 [Perca flavescens]|uniref:Uncharacterized protein n=1 Tax=Perca flavescens TaxID=8167 RepID=A0A484DDJ5_PERFV|nr:hypothetical protein EPR50_G00034990 [Perca flavescens]